MTLRHLAAYASALSLALTATTAHAEKKNIPISMTVSGGVSLGAYEAGYLYYFSELLKRNRDRFSLHVVTGASAGSVNSLLTALGACMEPEDDPGRTLFFRSWIGVGFKQLFVPEDTQSTALLSRRALEPVMVELQDMWRAGLPERCDFVFGVATTRLIPGSLAIRENVLSLPRTEEKFLLRIQGRGPGKPPLVTNYIDEELPLGSPLLPVDGDAEGDFTPIRDLLYASSAFPMAFAPVKLRYCHWVPGKDADGRTKTPRCTPADARQDLFIDGGVFDNQPMRLAAHTVDHGLEKGGDGRYHFRDSLARKQLGIPEDMLFWYIDPDVTAFPAMPADPSTPTKSWLSLAAQFLDSYVSTAETKTLYSLFERHPELLDQVAVGMSYYPTTSGLLGAFFGFFDTQLRIFDFYLGMHDAARLTHEQSDKSKRSSPAEQLEQAELAQMVPVEASMPRDEQGLLTGVWRPFGCMQGMLDGDTKSLPACEDESLGGFRILLQVAVDRLYEHCARLPEKGVSTTAHPQCARAMKGDEPPRVPGLKARAERDEWKRNDGEGDFDYTMRLLGQEQFVFTDLGLKAKEATEARQIIRYELAKVIDRFASVQPDGASSALLRLGAGPLLNSLAYQPPEHIMHFTVGPVIEFGWTVTKPTSKWAWFRPGLSLSVDGLSSLASGATPFFGLVPAFTAEFEPLGLNSSALQWRIGARVGWLFSTGDRFMTRPCVVGGQTCSRLSTQLYLAVSLFERLRVQLAGAYYPPLRPGEPHAWAFIPSAGFQFNFPY